MQYISPQFLFLIEAVIFATAIFMHLSKKSSSIITLYILQSLMVVSLLFLLGFGRLNLSLWIVVFLMLAVKVVIAPYFFFNLIRKHHLKVIISTYANIPITLVILAILTVVANVDFLRPLTTLAPANGDSLLLAVSIILISIFLIINKRGALSQMIGILSLENAIVSFASFAGLEQSAGLEAGIIFDILMWVIIASVFASMLYRQFGSLDVTSMKNLTE
jgi:hydrogenase-4 component E